MKNTLFFILFLIAFQSSFAQSKDDWNMITTGKWMYELNPSPFVSLYKMNYFTDDLGNEKTLSQLLESKNINIDSLAYAQIELDSILYLATKKNATSDVRLFKILKDNQQYFILCNEESAMCDCKWGTFFYYKPDLRLQRIEKPFSFSLKRNLISRLSEFNISPPIGYENMDFCEILEKL